MVILLLVMKRDVKRVCSCGCWSSGAFRRVHRRRELALDTREVAMHGSARGIAVMRGQRVDDGGVVGQRLGAQRRRVEMILDPRPQLAAPLLPQRLDDERE